MLASVAASPVFRPGPWRARVQPASEPVFQLLMACGCFCTAVPGSGLPAGVCLFFGIVSVPVSRGPVVCVALLLCFGVCTKGFGDPSAVCLCPGSPRVPVRMQGLYFLGFCVFISLDWSPSGALFLSRSLLSFPGPKFFSRNPLLWLRMCLPGF